jgi:hypothetical protein
MLRRRTIASAARVAGSWKPRRRVQSAQLTELRLSAWPAEGEVSRGVSCSRPQHVAGRFDKRLLRLFASTRAARAFFRYETSNAGRLAHRHYDIRDTLI